MGPFSAVGGNNFPANFAFFAHHAASNLSAAELSRK
jgi:hypothetical protein